MLRNHLWGLFAFIWGQFHSKCPTYIHPWYDLENYWFKITSTSARGHWFYYGLFVVSDVDECQGVPCVYNPEQCEDIPNGYDCNPCPPGITGRHCDRGNMIWYDMLWYDIIWFAWYDTTQNDMTHDKGGRVLSSVPYIHAWEFSYQDTSFPDKLFPSITTVFISIVLIPLPSCFILYCFVSLRGGVNIKILSYQHRNPHYKDKTVSWRSYLSWPSYLYNTI